MIIQSREVVRKAFAALLRTNMTGTGKPVETVFDHLTADFGGASPVIVIGNGGAHHTPFTFDGAQAKFRLKVFFLVWYGDKDTAPVDYTLDSAEQIMDEMDRMMAEIIEANKTSPWWNALTQLDFSEPVDLDIGGNYYLRESYLVEVE